MIKTAFRYLNYRIFAPHRKGFGVHSPFVFHLATEVLNGKDDVNIGRIASWRRDLNREKLLLVTADSGAGSKVHREKGRTIGSIASKSSIHHKYGKVLYALVKEFHPTRVIEMGTGIGVSTAYLAMANPECKVISMEADKSKIDLARKQFEHLGLRNVTIIEGYFREVLHDTFKEVSHPLLVFIDGDHSFEGTMEYFSEIKKHVKPDSVIVFDDIRWSAGMEKAWNAIKSDPEVVLTIDLFFMGIVFFREGMTRQDFVVNF